MSKFGEKKMSDNIVNVKQYCHISNKHTQICLIAKFCEKIRIENLGPKMLYLGILGLEKTKVPKFRTNNTSFSYFLTEV